MSLEVPDNVYQAMRDGHAAWERLVAAAQLNSHAWSEDQLKQFSMLVELARQHHNILDRLIKANT